MEEHAKGRQEVCMDKIIRKMEKLAAGRVNDAVKLAFLDGERVDEIDRLDLTALTEFKRSGNGAVEVKLTDRMMVLEKIAGLLTQQDEDSAERFFRALEADTGPDKGGA
ncbi:MAG: XRE family transcriptional regulator [Pseudoflavonifractor sp.]